MARMQTDTFREWIRWKYERAPATNPKPFFAMEEARDWTNVLQGTAFLCFRLKKHNDRYQKRHRITGRSVGLQSYSSLIATFFSMLRILHLHTG
ncbi:uncharacterized protein LOC122513568 isoform X7 [Polistes fuscatus]|uniref:uncharacterized protein LOC122513568 isoform X7 n=1 Tax=Polistes fuscatus TaxID=30207 RepID=UPI001CA7F4D4|nr:uncharacterized protein LOC122513568 isoform X7 [Polistes fuscatus]